MIPPSTPTRTVRPASGDGAWLLLGWSSPFGDLVASVIVRILSTRVYPGSAGRLRRAGAGGFFLADEADRAAVLLGDLLDRDLGRRDDRVDVGTVACIGRPAHREVAAFAASFNL